MGIPDERAPVLEARGLVKRFGQVLALRGVDFDLRPGEVHALCGENGAGKSTLIKTLSGIWPHGSYEGEIVMGGAVQHFANISDSERVGLSVIHQELALVPEMTVAENVFLGHEPRRFGLVDHDRMIGDTDELLSRWGINVSAAALIADLGVGQRQLVEIAKALRKDSKVLILDEPSAALTDKEVAVLLDIVRELRSRGVSSVYISHRLEEVFALSDRITVLRDGQTVVTLDTAKTDRNAIIAHMVGREMDNLFPRRPTTPGETLLAVKGLSVAERAGEKARLSGISFDLRQGEVLGIGGLMGAGRSELLMHLFGIWGKRTAGSATIEKAPLGASPGACIKQGLVLVTEDRKRYGLVLDQTVGFNLSLSAIAEFSQNQFVDRDQEVKKNAEYVGSLRIKASSQETITRTLSGGNQQKIVLGKALMTKPKVVLLDEPTRGIDVGAKFEIYELINDLKAQGVAVLLVSSELPELIGMSDRILMLAEGRIGGSFEGSAITQEALLAAAMRPTDPATPASAQEVA